MGTKKKRILVSVLQYGVLAVILVFLLFPLYWVLMTSFKTNMEAYRFPPTMIPESPTVQSYIMSEEKISQYFEDVTPAYPSRQSMEDLAVVKDSAILAGAAGSVSNVKPVTFIPTLSDLNLELCTLAQAVTVSGTDVDTAIANFEKAAKAVIEQ
jgi:ABC-type glycerol-3-phosphate transport system permease component